MNYRCLFMQIIFNLLEENTVSALVGIQTIVDLGQLKQCGLEVGQLKDFSTLNNFQNKVISVARDNTIEKRICGISKGVCENQSKIYKFSDKNLRENEWTQLKERYSENAFVYVLNNQLFQIEMSTDDDLDDLMTDADLHLAIKKLKEDLQSEEEINWGDED